MKSSNKSQAQIARDLGIADSTLHHWGKLFAEDGEHAFPGSGHQKPQEEEIRHLKRELEITKQERDILKKRWVSSRAASRDVPFIAEQEKPYPVTRLCKTLEVSISGYYAWQSREASEHSREDARLSAEIQQLFLDHRQVSGSPRIHALLKTRGIHCSRKRVVRLMRQLGLCAQVKKRRKPTTKSDPHARFALNHLNRDFTAQRPNSKWVTDTKAVETVEGWLFVAAIVDLFSRMVVGWAMGASEDGEPVELALHMAVARRHPEAGLLHHSDRGSEFTCERYQSALRQIGVQVSMSRTANCWDNAAMESFFATLAKECTDPTRWQTRQQASSAIFEYLECFYHPLR